MIRAKINYRSQSQLSINHGDVSSSTNEKGDDDVSVSTGSGGVTFLHANSSLLHLSTMDEPSVPRRILNNNNDNVAQTSRAGAALASILSASVPAILGTYVSMSGSVETGNVLLLLSVFTGAAGWKMFGGDEVRELELPRDGGYDAKFFVDRVGRLNHLLDVVRSSTKYDKNGGADNRDNDDISLERLSKINLAQKRAYTLLLANEVHDPSYVESVRQASIDSKRRDVVRRLDPRVMRTLVDRYSFDAAIDAASVWIECAERVFVHATEVGSNNNRSGEGGPTFALVRPPSHHATRCKGMGGCLLNGPAIAARHIIHHSLNSTLEEVMPRVAILDIDAHHGNGIANCVQDEPRIRYVSIHERVVGGGGGKVNDEVGDTDPRGPGEGDTGPLGNVRNVVLEPNTNWEGGYRRAFVEQALPFLLPNRILGEEMIGMEEGAAAVEEEESWYPDLLIVSAGFDALDADRTSSLRLTPDNYGTIGRMIREAFGDRVVFGLEGGYVWEGENREKEKGNDVMGEALIHLVSPWISSSRSSY